MILFICDEWRVNYMINESVYTIGEDVIDECLADSVEKPSK